MATRAGRGGQRRPGAGILRLSIVLVILILTFDKTVFLFRLAGAAFRSGTGGRGYLTAMADCSSRRPVLLPLLTAESGDPEFLAAWMMSWTASEIDMK